MKIEVNIRKFKLFYAVVLSLAISIVSQAQYSDYIGAGHSSGITVTASSSDDGCDPSYLIDGSGLDITSWEHDKQPDNSMWTNGVAVTSPLASHSDIGTWIQFDFGQVYQLSDIWVWNYAEEDGSEIGLREVIIDYSTDGVNWTELSSFEWPQVADNAQNLGFQGAVFNGLNARYVMISCLDNWGSTIMGLAEVKFNIGIGETVAGNPYPLNNSTNVFKETVLTWEKVYGSGDQNVHFGTSNPPRLIGAQSGATYNPGTLMGGTTYYWKIDDGPVWSFTTSGFGATGFTDSTSQPTRTVPHYPIRSAPVEVTFENTPTKLFFAQPTMPIMFSENNIGYNNGYLETHDRNHPSNPSNTPYSWETIGDVNCETTRVWIEHQSPARIVVRQTAGLGVEIDGQYRVAHDDLSNGTNYNGGMGDWANETYVIYPDGMHIRHAKVHSGRLNEYAAPFHEPIDLGGPEIYDPFFEFNEGLVHLNIGRSLRNCVEPYSVTLVKMDGSSADISFDPLMSDEYPGWSDANTQLINLNAEYDPFVIALPDNVYTKPYFPDGCPTPDDGCYPNVWFEGAGGSATPIGHVLNWTHYKDSISTMISNVYLSGHIKSSNVATDLHMLAKSWINAPELAINGSGFSGGEYQQHERAYVFDRSSAGTTYLNANINASTNNPLVRPAFVFNDWGSSMITSITWNGTPLVEGTDFNHGKEGENMIIYINKESSIPVQLIIGEIINSAELIKSNNNNLTIFPNPAKKILYATLQNMEGMVEVSISSIDGRVISRRRIHATKDERIKIPVSNLRNGMYVFSFKWSGNTATKKILIK